MSKVVKRILLGILVIAIVFTAKYVYDIHLNYNFKKITDGKVYSSGVIPPEKISDYIEDYYIKTIIDFRHPGIIDELNPANETDIELEKKAVAKIPGVRHVNIPSDQVPTQQNLDSLFNVFIYKI